MTILVVTVSDDREAPARVGAALSSRGAHWFRLDSDRYPDLVSLSSRLGGDAVERSLHTPDGALDLARVTAMWFRRFHAGAALPSSLAELRAPAVEEARRTLLGHLSALRVPALNGTAASARAEAKELQLVLARAHGLSVPPTLITNDPNEARAFFLRCDGRVVAKVQSSWTVPRDGAEQVVFTSEVDQAALACADRLRLAPMTFQARIEAAHDVRVVVVGDRVLAAELSCTERARPDWRRDGMARLGEWRRARVPPDVAGALRALSSDLGIGFCAADFVRDAEGRLWFLEVNAGGEWVWIDDVHRGAVADAIAGELVRLSSSSEGAVAPSAARARAESGSPARPRRSRAPRRR